MDPVEDMDALGIRQHPTVRTLITVAAVALLVVAALAWWEARTRIEPRIEATTLIHYQATDRPDLVLITHWGDSDPDCNRPLGTAAFETDDAVVVVRQHERLREFCTLAAGEGDWPSSQAVCLSRPLDDRAIIDGSSGEPLPEFRASTTHSAPTAATYWAHCIRARTV